MENKHTPGLPAISYPAGNYAIVTFEIPEDISKSQSHAIVRGPKHKKYAKLIASAPSLQSEIDRLKKDREELIAALEYALERLNDFDYKSDDFIQETLNRIKQTY